MLRAALLADLPRLAPIERAADALYVAAGHIEFALAPVINDADATSAISDARITVAEVDGEVVGWVMIDRAGHERSITQISVLPAHGRQGIGSALLRHVIGRCDELTIVLDTQADVAWNKPWYERFGFEVVDQSEWTPAMRDIVQRQTAAGFRWATRVHMRRSLAPLPPPMADAMELAWQSFQAGSLGIGAVVTDADGVTVATGRNRLSESTPGDDVLAGTSLAHAEMNVLAKLRWGANRHRQLTLWTTLQPCLQCLGAIRLSDVETVQQLSPDPLWAGIEQVRTLNRFLAERWPSIYQRPLDEWAALSILLPTFVGVFWEASPPGWVESLPNAAGLARELTDSGELLTAAAARTPLDQLAASLWSRLSPVISDLE